VARTAIILGVCALMAAGCGSSPTGKSSVKRSQAVEDQHDSEAIQRQVNQQVDERARIRITEEEADSQVESSHVVNSATVCTKQSTTAYKCLTTFTSPPSTANIVTNVTCDRDGQNCITESK
jgi:hypothetical protein